MPAEGSEEEWEEAKEEVEEGEAVAKGSQEQLRESLEAWDLWPYFDRGVVCGAKEEARKRQVHVLRCQEHKAWYLWHPPLAPRMRPVSRRRGGSPQRAAKGHGREL